ncbi:hypothetical protein F511_02958 [Dorcoceras hygrometricum]|uniref:Uncharacterized protein n=1 Tax=Dorcoceras hygrometricum TaxID=472368 RepID=A0A2Z7AKZ4_9LAMI|nr:hypothetical protein F511_02958 [Dorcoceras hygrometricum]
MEDDREGDIRVPLVSFLFCLCLITGGIFLALYVFVPNLSQPWYPVAAFALIGLPWLFWLLTYIYACMKGCFGAREGGAVDSRQISRRQTTRNVSNSASAAAAMQNHSDGGGGGNQQSGGVNSSVASSRESEMPLTYSV